MPGIGGLSIANNLLSNAVQLNLNNNQKALQASTTRLSSGLRINTAADDPSGLAISQTLQSQVNGFDQASQNVQNATNAAQVADGALQTTTDILQRIRSLAVEAASDITSSSDKQDVQTEINQLLLEVNRVAQNTQFNGIALLDGSHAGFQAEQSAFVAIQSNASLASAGVNPVITGGTSSTSSSTSVGFLNGDFSSPSVPPGTSSSSAQPTGWAVAAQAGGAWGLGNGPGFFSGSPAGEQGVLLIAAATATQTLTGLTPGTSYSVSFEAAAGNNPSFSVTANGTDITPSNLDSTLSTSALQTYTTQSFTSDSSGDATITFTLLTSVSQVALTDVSLNAPSSPSSTSTSTSTSGVNTGLLIASAVAANVNFGTTVGTAGNGLQGIQGFTSASLTAGYTVDGTIEVQVINTGASIAAQETFFASGVQATATTSPVSVAGQLLSADSISTLFDNVQITTGNFTSADVGVTSYIKVSQDVAAITSTNTPAFTFQSGALEGATIQLGIGASNTQTLRIANVNVLLSSVSDPSIGAEDAIGQIDLALQSLLTERANLGAVIVRLGEDQDNDNVASVNLQSSESNIADLNVASETTNFNKLQILVQVGTSVLAQSNSNAQSVLKLFP